MKLVRPAPATPRAADWRDTAACREEDTEIFFALGSTGAGQHDIEQAKTICGRCPAVDACLDFALTNSIGYGVYGGLTDHERANHRRAAVRRNLTAEESAARAEQARQAQQPRTLQSLYDRHTVRLYGGHVAWTGPAKISFRGQTLTPRRLAFTHGRGRKPVGPVTADCGNTECVLPAHLTDSEERARCGTRPGYQRHRKNGEAACGSCTRANADADNRLRRTGTTKKVAV
ncbi:WhiB family transcriptional regulator [Streptomyces adelaidensis]|uniref:WhiB family transcriptional regulator n=1 Tax=Streptomyces adelaidensis TaxID=2796465 RepID=UPI0019036284